MENIKKILKARLFIVFAISVSFLFGANKLAASSWDGTLTRDIKIFTAPAITPLAHARVYLNESYWCPELLDYDVNSKSLEENLRQIRIELEFNYFSKNCHSDPILPSIDIPLTDLSQGSYLIQVFENSELTLERYFDHPKDLDLLNLSPFPDRPYTTAYTEFNLL